MAHTVLVLLDGSSLAERALGYAKGFAQSTGGRIILLRVVPSSPSSATGDSLDYSELAEAVIEPVERIAPALRAELILLSITPLIWSADPYGVGYLAYDMDADEADRQNYLDQVAARLRATGLSVKTRTGFGFPEDVIVNVARDEDVDLIAMSSHGSGGITRLVLGSTATGVVHRAPVPVVIVRPAAVLRTSEAVAGAPMVGSPDRPVHSPGSR